MIRPSRDELMVATAFTWAQRSTCSRLQVGAVVHRDGRILVQGYNGAPAGLPHCWHGFWDGTTAPPKWAEEWFHKAVSGALGVVYEEVPYVSPECPMWMNGDSVTFGKNPAGCTRSVHAEQNAIAFAAKHGVSLNGADLVSTHEPCGSCSMSIINAGIRSVTYVYPYRLHDGVELLREAGLVVEQYLDWEEPRLVESPRD